jgi:DNA polymerase
MSDFQRVLDVTEQHLLTLKAAGVRFLSIEPLTLSQLREPPPRVEFQPDATQETNRTDAPALELSKLEKPPEQPSPRAADAQSTMPELRQRAAACLKCPHLVKSRKNVVFGVGDIHARLMFVGEAPGADEDAQGEPFVGAAGQLLTRIIKAMGLSRETVYIANILKCRPDTPGQSAGNRRPTAEEMKTCLPYLLAQIDLIRPKVLVALGATAMEGLLGAGGGIGKLRGKFQTFRDIPLMPTFHPAYLLRNQSQAEKRKVWEDMLQVMEKLQMPISEKQRRYFTFAG